MSPAAPQMSLSEKFRLLMEWMPALQMLPVIASSQPGRDQVLQVVRLLEIVAGKTVGNVDDELARLIKDVLLTEQGGKLVDYIVAQIKELTDGNS
jgi:hypothetical protein